MAHKEREERKTDRGQILGFETTKNEITLFKKGRYSCLSVSLECKCRSCEFVLHFYIKRFFLQILKSEMFAKNEIKIKICMNFFRFLNSPVSIGWCLKGSFQALGNFVRNTVK